MSTAVETAGAVVALCSWAIAFLRDLQRRAAI
jgi:hypothetical protein